MYFFNAGGDGGPVQRGRIGREAGLQGKLHPVLGLWFEGLSPQTSVHSLPVPSRFVLKCFLSAIFPNQPFKNV